MNDNASLSARRAAATPRAVTPGAPFFVDRAENAELWDVEGYRYVDFAGGIAALNTGHRHPAVMQRVEQQLQRVTHTAWAVAPYEPYVELAERLNALAPGSTPKKSLFVTTGAEAVENAVKVARAWTGRSDVIAFNGSFHGRTLLTMGLTGKVDPYKRDFGPFPGDLHHIPFPMAPHGITVDDSFAALEWLFHARVEPERVAAIIIEPVQGEGGFNVAPPSLLQRLRELCDAHGICLIVDEVQSGFARTGRLFAVEHAGIEPDLMTVAKSMAGGFPLAGLVGKAAIMDAAQPGGLGGTYAGNPVSCAAALGVLDAIEQQGLVERSAALGARIVSRLQQIAARDDVHPIGELRGLGSMIAFDLVTAAGSTTPDPEAARALCARARAHGLVLLSCGVYGNTIRILVPLTAPDAIVEEGLAILEHSLATIATGHQAA